MTKNELIEVVTQKADLSKADATLAVDTVFDAIGSGVKESGTVRISGFGSFNKKERAARMGVNPKTGEKIQIKASTSVGFKPATALKEKMA